MKKPENQKIQYKMDFMEKITLDPIEKYTRYNKFPWKLIVHLGLLIFTTVQVTSVVSLRADHTRSMHQNFKYLLMDSMNERNDRIFNNLKEFQNHLQTITDRFYNLNNSLFMNVDLSTAKFHLEVTYLTMSKENIDKVKYPIDISKGILNPFNVSDIGSLKNLLNTAQQISISAKTLTTRIFYLTNSQRYYCMNWDVEIFYNFETQSHVHSHFNTFNNFCRYENTDDLGKSNLFVHIMVLLLSIISLILSWKYIYQMAKDYMHYMMLYKKVSHVVRKTSSKKNLPEFNRDSLEILYKNYELKYGEVDNKTKELLEFKKTWEELGLFDKLKFFDFWFIFGVIGNFIQINASIIAILYLYAKENLSIFTLQEMMVGLGCGFSWLLILKYLEYNPNINLMTSTLKNSASNIFSFFVGVFPMYFAFVFLGQMLFWKYDKFQDSSNAVTTLFSISYGDIIFSTTDDILPEGFISEAFIICYILLFFTAVQNVFITIIMEGYEKTRKELKKQRPKKKPEEEEDQEDYEDDEKMEKEEVQQLSSEPDLISDDKLNKIEEEIENSKRFSTIHPSKPDEDLRKLISQPEESFQKIGELTESFFLRDSTEKKEEVIESSQKDKLVESFEMKNLEISEKIEKLEIPEKIEKIEKSEKSEKKEKSEKIEIPEKIEKKDEMLLQRESEEKKEFQESFGILSPEKLTGPFSDKDRIMNQLKGYIKKINNIMEELEKIPEQLEHVEFSMEDKKKIIEYYKEHVENVCGNLKFHISMHK